MGNLTGFKTHTYRISVYFLCNDICIIMKTSIVVYLSRNLTLNVKQRKLNINVSLRHWHYLGDKPKA